MWSDPESFCPRMTIEEAIERGYLPADIRDSLPPSQRNCLFIESGRKPPHSVGMIDL